MRHRTDANQAEIIAALEKIGCSVYVIGRPTDLLVGRTGANGRHNYLLECKSRSGTKTSFQRKFFSEWRGQVKEVRSVNEALTVVTESYTR